MARETDGEREGDIYRDREGERERERERERGGKEREIGGKERERAGEVEIVREIEREDKEGVDE